MPYLRTGVVHVGYEQTFVVNDTDADVSVTHYVYENARLTLPPRVFFYDTGLHTAGDVFGIEDMYMFQGGVVAVNETGSLTTNPGKNENTIHHKKAYKISLGIQQLIFEINRFLLYYRYLLVQMRYNLWLLNKLIQAICTTCAKWKLS